MHFSKSVKLETVRGCSEYFITFENYLKSRPKMQEMAFQRPWIFKIFRGSMPPDLEKAAPLWKSFRRALYGLMQCAWEPSEFTIVLFLVGEVVTTCFFHTVTNSTRIRSVCIAFFFHHSIPAYLGYDLEHVQKRVLFIISLGVCYPCNFKLFNLMSTRSDRREKLCRKLFGSVVSDTSDLT